MEVDATRGAQNTAQKVVYIIDLVIGIRDPERNKKQRVVVDLEVSEQENATIDNYQNVVRRISDVSPA